MHKIYISGKVIVTATGHSADCAPCSWSLFNQSLHTETLLKYSLQSLTCRVREISTVDFASFTAAGEQRKPLTAGEITTSDYFATVFAVLTPKTTVTTNFIQNDYLFHR
jgi:hypothetical protein